MFFVFDLDGTLVLIDHRRHHVTGGKRNFKAFEDACVDDSPYVPVVATALALRDAGHRVEIWSGRSSRVALRSSMVLRGLGLGDFPLRMRQEGDFRADQIVKEEWLDAAIAHGGPPDMVFDDRQKVVNMWRRRGIPCAQVAPGDF